MPPAARVTDMHVCPMVTVLVPHVGGPILPPGAPTVLIGFLPAATVTNMLTCVGPPDVIVKGSTGVFINFLPAARVGDQTAHGGAIVLGDFTVMVGEIGAPSPGAGGAGGIAAGLVAAGVIGPTLSQSFVASLSQAAAAGTPPTPLTQQEMQLLSSISQDNGITDPVKIGSNIDGCAPAVTAKTLQPGDKVVMWVRDNGQPGIWAMPPGTDPETVGIILEGRHPEEYVVTEAFTVVQSKAKDFEKGIVEGVGGKGGGTQWIMPPTWKAKTQKL
jgi:uncharacterized Zn-binding protein involved in type VI secretion